MKIINQIEALKKHLSDTKVLRKRIKKNINVIKEKKYDIHEKEIMGIQKDM